MEGSKHSAKGQVQGPGSQKVGTWKGEQFGTAL